MGRFTVRRRILGGAGAALALTLVAALPVAAGAAPAISTDAVCLRPGQTADGQQISPALRIAGIGFTPGATVSVTRGQRALTGVAREDGAFSLDVSVIDLLASRLPTVRSLAVTAKDDVAGVSNTLRLKAAPLAFSATPARATPSSAVLFRFSGFTPGRTIHAHYVHGGRVRANARMAAAKAPCGTAAVRRVQIPLARPAVGTWTVQFDNSARYSPRSRPRLTATIEVYGAGAGG